MEGYIYVVEMEGHKVFKIGRSNSVPRRMSEIGVQMPYPYRLRFALRVWDAHKAETTIHETLARYRANGEWFHLNEAQIEGLRLTLLITQANNLLDKIVDAFNGSYQFSTLHVNRYANLIIKANTRLERRRHRLWQLRDYGDSAPVHHAEFIQ